MAATLPDIQVTTSEWVDLNSESGIPVGDRMNIQNKKGIRLLLVESETQPTASFNSGVTVAVFPEITSIVNIPAGSLRIWAKAIVSNPPFNTATINVQSVA